MAWPSSAARRFAISTNSRARSTLPNCQLVMARQDITNAPVYSPKRYPKRRIKTQTILPCADTAAMLFWALLASGQIVMRKVDGWQTLSEKPSDQIMDLAA